MRDIARAQNKLQNTFPQAQKWAKIVSKISFAATSLVLPTSAAELVAPFTGVIALGGFAASEVLSARTASESWKITFIDNYLS